MKRIYTLVLMLALISTANAAVIDCSGCADCTSKIQNATAGDTVRLTTDISGCSGTCIEFNRIDWITFDGGGHTIDGTIYMFFSSYNTIQGITVRDTGNSGITLLYGHDNIIRDCTLQENPHYDFNFVPALTGDCNNVLINVTGSGGHPIGYYTGKVNLQDQEFSALYLCNASKSTFSNITVSGSDNIKNNGIRVYMTNDTVLNGIVSVENCEGIAVCKSNNVTVADSVFDDNHHYDTFIKYGSNNTFRNLSACRSGQCGLYLYHTTGNHIEGINASWNPIGIKFDTSNSMVINGSIIVDNGIKGLSGIDSTDNLVYNNHFDNINNVYGSPGCVWNITPIAGTNIVGGSWLGGNYWNDYTGNDSDDDGIGDTPYDTGHGFDQHPLTSPSPTPTPTPTPTPSPNSTTISIGAGTGVVTLPIMISDSENVGSIDVTLSYNPDVVDVTGVTGRGMDCTFSNLEHTSEGWIRVGAIQSDNDGLSGQFTLLNVDLAPVGSNTQCELILNVTTFKDSTPECVVMTYNISNGVYTSSQNGDSNGDAVVDIADAAYIAKHILGISGYESIDEGAADVNGDGIVDMSDAMYLSKHVIGITGYEELH